jgi:hypothetical protein
MDKAKLMEVAEAALVHANKVQIDADSSKPRDSNGNRNDGGANIMRRIAYAYINGLNNELPDGWDVHWDKVTKKHRDAANRADPEWTEYQRLQKKFTNVN